MVVERHLAGGHDPAPARLAHAVHAQGVAFAFHQPRLRVAGARRKPDNFGDALDGLPAPDFADRLPFAPEQVLAEFLAAGGLRIKKIGCWI